MTTTRWARPAVTAKAHECEGKKVRVTYNTGPHYRSHETTITGTMVVGPRPDRHVTLVVGENVRKGIHVTRVRNIQIVR